MEKAAGRLLVAWGVWLATWQGLPGEGPWPASRPRAAEVPDLRNDGAGVLLLYDGHGGSLGTERGGAQCWGRYGPWHPTPRDDCEKGGDQSPKDRGGARGHGKPVEMLPGGAPGSLRQGEEPLCPGHGEAEPGGREECGGAAGCLCGAPGSDRPPRGPEEQAKGSGHGGTTRMGTADCHMQRTDRRRGGRGDGGAVWSTTAESHAGGTADPAEIQADCGADNAPSADCCSQAATFAVPEPVCCGGGPDWHGGPHDRWVRDADGGAPLQLLAIFADYPPFAVPGVAENASNADQDDWKNGGVYGDTWIFACGQAEQAEAGRGCRAHRGDGDDHRRRGGAARSAGQAQGRAPRDGLAAESECGASGWIPWRDGYWGEAGHLNYKPCTFEGARAILDVGYVLASYLDTLFYEAAEFLQTVANGWIHAVCLVWLTALLVVGLRPIWRRSSSERSCRRTALGSMPGRICLAWLVVQRVAAGRHEVAGDPPPDAASMYWAEGHTTMQEQLMRALHRVVLESPLGRSPGTLAPDELTVPAPVAGNLVDPEPPHAVHISLFIMSPFFEPETIDMGVPFPLTINRLHEFAKDMPRHLPSWLSHTVEVMPQIHEDYATFLNIPSWVPLSGTTALVVDASAFSRGTFAFYAEGLISRRAILRLINLSGLEDPDVFAFGDLAPLRDDETRNPMQGGLIRVLRRGQVIEWGSPLSERLLQPGRWQPATETPPPYTADSSHSRPRRTW